MFVNIVIIILELVQKKGGNYFLGKSFMIMDTPKIKPDPLNFKDSKKYIDRLKNAQRKIKPMIRLL